MGKLKGRGLPNRLGRQPSRFSKRPETEADRTRARDAVQPWRAWYKTARWQKLRRLVLKRDGYVCQKTGVALVGKYPAANSPVADHKVPHRGDPDLFWDPRNIEAVSKDYHDKVKQSIERRGLV
jgi:5-methylcytosine-specific restriction endonuclease McrA